MTIAQELAEFGAGLRWGALPEAVQRRARLCLLDMLGATLAGSETPTAELGATLAARHGSGGAARLIGRPQRTSALFAALANGMTCHSLELDDGHRYAVGLHNGATTIPAALAVAEEEDVDLERLLVALVLGYEVAGRVGTVVNPAHRRAGFHSTGTIGVFGAAAAAGYLRGLTSERLAGALGIAGSASGGIFEFLSEGCTSKHFHAGHAAMAGVLAADLSHGGMTGPSSIFEGREGFCRVYGRDADTRAITRELGERFEMRNVYFKLHAACGNIFSVIDAVQELRERAGPVEVERMVVRSYRAAAILDEPRPDTKAAAKFSIPYCAAVAWLHGSIGEEQFSGHFLADPALRWFAERVEVAEDPAMEADFPRTRSARVEVTLRDGRRLEAQVDVPRGMPERPASEEELMAKFRGLAAPILGAVGSGRLLKLVLEGRRERVRVLADFAGGRASPGEPPSP